MISSLKGFDWEKWRSYADWKLLILLVFFLNVKLAVKIPVIVLIYIWQFDFRFGFRLKNSRLPLFYLLALLIPIAGLAFNKSYLNPNYAAVFLTGIFFWILCILAIHQVKLSVESHQTETIHHTLLLFFIINAVFSAGNLLVIIWNTSELNPYTYQGQFQKYFISTGDYIKGITFDTSVTNAVINAFGVIYFLVRKQVAMLLACMVCLLLTGSNFINILLLLIFLYLFILKSNRDQKSMILACLMFLVVFMAKVSPQNNRYVAETFKDTFDKDTVFHYPDKTVILPIAQRPDSVLNSEERKIKTATLFLDSLSLAAALEEKEKHPLVSQKPIIRTEQGTIVMPQADIHSATYQSLKVPLAPQKPLQHFISLHKRWLPISSNAIAVPTLPGKATALIQTLKFYSQHPARIFLGDGMGNFSSKLAFRVSGLSIAGGFPKRYDYISNNFMQNHLDLYLNFFSKRADYHSLTNSPFSVYDQLMSEYGLTGLISFLIFYWLFFARHYKKLTYGIPILLLVTAVLFVDYWFEQLSILVLFELLLLLNIKETNPENSKVYGHV
ncbi:hypothetical protein [Dyadobacter frigoris]|uniref:O-antigen ligase family protein n=1 Tax=Dyadobacter frigoris TaxID=2576211 RepID=A0A4V6BJ48_9BACT|nr:hypothetical protein [Dyadobacter frigoris]TKT90613.1 hypothetical protein FDK13_20025 [Dyadobacter frigoris]GLU51238.1 hypothetical protein Dfri01_06990 [Dyadobacter frigoris]